MKSFTIIKSEEKPNETVFRLIYVDDKGTQQDYGVVDNKDVLDDLQVFAKWVDSLKTKEELKAIELEEKVNQALKKVQEIIPDEKKAEFIALYPAWEIGKGYIVGDEFQHENVIYRVLQPHTSQADWLPQEAVSLYVNILNKVTILEFKQPTGAHDVYHIGDKVLFNGKIYRSIIDNNGWSPADYPQGWELEG